MPGAAKMPRHLGLLGFVFRRGNNVWLVAPLRGCSLLYRSLLQASIDCFGLRQASVDCCLVLGVGLSPIPSVERGFSCGALRLLSHKPHDVAFVSGFSRHIEKGCLQGIG